MREGQLKLIHGLPIFRHLEDAVFAETLAACRIMEFAPLDIIAVERVMPKDLFILLDGLVENFSERDGKSTTLSLMRPPAAFILAAVVMRRPYLVSVRAISAAKALAMPIELFHALFARDPQFALSASQELATRYRDMVKELKNLKTRTAVERLANWILSEAHFAGDKDEFEMMIGKAMLASRLGMTNEHLSRAFAQLRDLGVETSGRHIRITNRIGLESFARPDPLIDGVDT